MPQESYANPMRDELERYIAEDFVEYGASGKSWTKGAVIEAMQTWPSMERELVDFSVRALSASVVLVTYKSIRQAEPPGAQRTSLRASIWRHNDTSWELLLHQGTPAQS